MKLFNKMITLLIFLGFVFSVQYYLLDETNGLGDPEITVELFENLITFLDPREEEYHTINGEIRCKVQIEDPRSIEVNLNVIENPDVSIQAAVDPGIVYFENGSGEASFVISIWNSDEIISGNYSIILSCEYSYVPVGSSGMIGEFPINISIPEYFGGSCDLIDYPSVIIAGERKKDLIFTVHNEGNSDCYFGFESEGIDNRNFFVEPLRCTIGINPFEEEDIIFKLSYYGEEDYTEEFTIIFGMGYHGEDLEIERFEFKIKLTFGVDPGANKIEANIGIEIEHAHLIVWENDGSYGYEKAISGSTSGCGDLYLGFSTKEQYDNGEYFFNLEKEPYQVNEKYVYDWSEETEWGTVYFTQDTYFIDSSPNGDWSSFEYYFKFDVKGPMEYMGSNAYPPYDSGSKILVIVRAVPNDEVQNVYSQYTKEVEVTESSPTLEDQNPFNRTDLDSGSAQKKINFIPFIIISIVLIFIAIIVFVYIYIRKSKPSNFRESLYFDDKGW